MIRRISLFGAVPRVPCRKYPHGKSHKEKLSGWSDFFNADDPTYLSQRIETSSVRKNITLRPRRCYSVRLIALVVKSNVVKHLPVFSTAFSEAKARCVGAGLRPPCCWGPVLAQSSRSGLAPGNLFKGRNVGHLKTEPKSCILNVGS